MDVVRRHRSDGIYRVRGARSRRRRCHGGVPMAEMTKRYPLHHEDAQPMYVNVLREEYETLKRKAREYDRIVSGKEKTDEVR